MTPSSCVNLGAKGKRRRFYLGVLLFLLAGGLATFFVFQEIPAFFRLLVWPPFFISTLCFLQAKDRTCVFLAYRHQTEVPGEPEKITDLRLAGQLKQKSQKIILQAFVISCGLAVLCFFF